MKSIPFSIILIFSLCLSACSEDVDSQEHVDEIYIAALDAMMGLDEALNHAMKFIAIDRSNFDDLDEPVKDSITAYFKEKYGVEVLVATLDQLKEKSLFHTDTMSLDGVLLRIEKVDFTSDKEVLVEGSKYKSGLGAVGVKSVVLFKDGKWQIKDSKVTWQS